MVDWKKIDIKQIEKYCLDTYDRWREYPSVRDIFYAFVDVLWPNTSSVYKRLSPFLRDARLKQLIDWRIIRDGAGRKYYNGDYSYKEPQAHFDLNLSNLRSLPDYYYLPHWLNQPKKVIVICEKEADYPVIKSILSAPCVDVTYIRGYSGWRLFFELVEKIPEGLVPFFLEIGDFDPSGEDIPRFVQDALRRVGISKFGFKKIMITKDQIEKYNLPHRPDDKNEIEKLKRDPRFKKWPYGLYRVETAALKSKHPEAFERRLTDEVNALFDPEIYKKTKELESKKRKELSEIIEKFFSRLDEK